MVTLQREAVLRFGSTKRRLVVRAETATVVTDQYACSAIIAERLKKGAWGLFRDWLLVAAPG